MGLRSALVWLMQVGDKMICAASFNFLSFQNRSLSKILISFHRGVWSPLVLQMCSASLDLCVSPLLSAFLCSSILTVKGLLVSPVYVIPHVHLILYTQFFTWSLSIGGLTLLRKFFKIFFYFYLFIKVS